MEFYYGTANDVYPRLLADLRDRGRAVGPRGTHTLELSPVTIALENPWRRLITSYGRPVNVTFALAEVLWMLLGRRDVEMLAFYNESIRQFSDDGVVFNAAYGYRMRRAHGFDQMEDVVHTLRQDTDSRRATLCIWHPNDRGWYWNTESAETFGSEPLARQTKDRACNIVAHMMIRDGALDWLQVVRSNDAVLGVPYNFFQWTCMQEFFARRLNVHMGRFHYIADSMHAYQDTYYDGPPEVTPFDLYEIGPSAVELMMSPHEVEWAWLLAAEKQERLVRVANSTPAIKAGFWGAALLMFWAHAAYKAGNNEQAMERLLMWPNIYSLAQIRFYWSMRWYKLPADERVRLLDQVADAVEPLGVDMRHWLTDGQ